MLRIRGYRCGQDGIAVRRSEEHTGHSGQGQACVAATLRYVYRIHLSKQL